MKTEIKLIEISLTDLKNHEEGKHYEYNWRHKINLYTKRFFSVKFYVSSNNDVFVSYKMDEIYYFNRFTLKYNLLDMGFCKITIDSEGYINKDLFDSENNVSNRRDDYNSKEFFRNVLTPMGVMVCNQM